MSVALGYAMDKKIHTERELLMHQNQAETIVNNIGEGVMVVSTDFKVLSANDFILSLTKMKRDEIIGNDCFEVFHERKEVCADCPVSVTFISGKPSCMVHEGRAKDGTKTYVELNTYPLKDSRGKVVKVVETVKDISEKKKHEDEIAERRYLEKVSKSVVGRELKMVELKKEINDLKKRMEKYETS
jgi:PAS domain S-box-containing protein